MLFWGSRSCGVPLVLRRLWALYLFFWGSGPCGAPLLLRRLQVLYLFFWGCPPCVVLRGRSFFPELQPPLYGPTGDEEESSQDEDGSCRFQVHGGGCVDPRGATLTLDCCDGGKQAMLWFGPAGFQGVFFRRNSLMQTQSPGSFNSALRYFFLVVTLVALV